MQKAKIYSPIQHSNFGPPLGCRGSHDVTLDLSRKNRPKLPELPDYRTDQVEIVPMGLPEFES